MHVSKSSKICFVCAIRPVLKIAWINTFSAKYFCEHSKPPSHPHFEKSEFLYSTALICCLFLIVSSGLVAAELNCLEFNELLLALMMVQSCVITVSITITLQKYTELQIHHIHGIIFIVEKSSSFGVKNFFEKKFKRKIFKIICQFFLPYLILTSVIVSSSLVNYQNLTKEMILKLITLLINIFTNLSNFIMTIFFVEIYFILFKKCHKSIETVLKNHLRHSDKFLVDFRLKKKLQILQTLHMKIFFNFQIVQKVFNVNLVLFYASFCTILISCFFIIIIRLWQQTSYSDEEMVLFVMYVSAFAGSNVFFKKIQDLSDENLETLSFLFKFPITKLDSVEATQVEVLIQTLILQRPNLRAAGIFSVGRRLMASMSGVVLMYALVALQIYMLWTKK